MKKLNFILIGVLLILCFVLLPMETKAETEGYFTYKIEGETACIIGVDSAADGDLVIPDTLGGYPVTRIYPHTSLWECKDIKTITIPASLKEIPEYTITTAPNLEHIYVEEGNPVYKSDSKGVLYNKKVNALVGAPQKLSGEYVVPEGVKVISHRAFYGCENLAQVILPESVTEIGWYAFVACDKLESVNIPAGVQEYLGLFAYCPSLTRVTIPYGVTKIPEEGFAGCSSLEYVDLPETVTFIGLEAFKDCASLKTIDLSHVTTIEEGAFDSCECLSGTIVLAEGLTYLDICTFYNCESLEAVQLPQSLTEIGDSAFAGCISLKELYIHSGITYVGAYNFVQKAFRVAEDSPYYTDDSNGVLFNKEKTSLIGVPREIAGVYTVPEGVITIERGAFSHCEHLTQVNIPEKVEKIGSEAFYRCTNLRTVNVPESLTTVAERAFAYCTSLTDIPAFKNVKSLSLQLFTGCTGFISVTVPEGVEEICTYAFDECSAMTSISLPKSIKSIGVRAFEECTALKEVITHTGPYSLEIDDWRNTNNCLMDAQWNGHTWGNPVETLAPTCRKYGEQVVTCTDCNFKMHIKVYTGEHTYGAVYEPDPYNAQYHSKVCTVCKQRDEGGKHQFVNNKCTVCGYVQVVVLPTYQEGVFTYTISDEKITITACDTNASGEIVIPETIAGYPVTAIAPGVFKDCTQIQKIIVSQDHPYFTADEYGVLFSKDKSILIFAMDPIAGKYEVPASVVSIQGGAFSGQSGLTEIVFSATLQEIGDSAFYECPNLSEVHFLGTAEQWQKVSKGIQNEPLYYADTISHQWVFLEMIQKPTCVQKGLKVMVCTVCNQKKRESIPKTNDHTYPQEWSTNDMWHGHKCTVCKRLVEWEYHTLGEPATTDAPQTCKVCGYELAPKLEKSLAERFWPLWVVLGAVVLIAAGTVTIVVLRKKRK